MQYFDTSRLIYMLQNFVLNFSDPKWKKWKLPSKKYLIRLKHQVKSTQMPNDWATAFSVALAMVSSVSCSSVVTLLNYFWCKIFALTIIGNRKSSDDTPLSPSLKRRRADDDSDISFNYSNISCNSTLNNSNQWEVRILKADLIEANTKVHFEILYAIQSILKWFALF